jgi:hypothetical protein
MDPSWYIIIATATACIVLYAVKWHLWPRWRLRRLSPEARAALLAGIASGRTCPGVYLGSFAQYADEPKWKPKKCVECGSAEGFTYAIQTTWSFPTDGGFHGSIMGLMCLACGGFYEDGPSGCEYEEKFKEWRKGRSSQ